MTESSNTLVIVELLQLLQKEFPVRQPGPKHYVEAQALGEVGYLLNIFAEQKKHISGSLVSVMFTVAVDEPNLHTSPAELVKACADIFYNTNWSTVNAQAIIEEPDFDNEEVERA